MTENIPAVHTTSATEESAEYGLSQTGCRFRVFSSVFHLTKDWEQAQPPRNLYLHRPLLTAIEEAPPKGIVPLYLVFYKNNAPIGVAYCQVTTFNTEQSVQDMEGKGKKTGAKPSVSASVKNYFAKKFEYNLLTCGNLLFTGEHGFHFDSNKIGRADFMELLHEALDKTQLFCKERNIKTDGVFIKDLCDGHEETCKALKAKKYREFLFHPTMVLHLREEWQSYDDYLQAISSKYRVRAKKAAKKGAALQRVVFTKEQLEKNIDRLYELYRGVMDTAGFNMVVLHENYILKLKEHLGDKFRVTGYYLDGELIGYRTNISNFDELEAHFLGYDQSFNKEYQLYMNMLLDSLKQAIGQRAKHLVYARTAMEIKSSIGAEPHDLFCFIKANNRLHNKMMPFLLEYFRPDDNWVQRRPFKENKN
ncbi:MAG TPA: GNAT family N-acetyltransferase [Bacteroidetes bacterium]|nr:GNAT family N-acetyltransferase [Bacteroidota bacterium]